MEGNQQGWYAAFAAKDTRFDGRFFVGVSSTGIYCRPVCRAKLPKIDHCHFFVSAAQAEAAGYRPCLLCRPELAPGISVTDATASLAHHAAGLLAETCGSGQRLPDLAEQLGYTDRHLRRAFAQTFHVSPVRYLQTCRLLLAKSLLTDTNLPMSDVAVAAGFGSVRRLNDLFRTQYKLSPTALRRGASGAREGITLLVGYRPPYPWQAMLAFLSGRTIRGVEALAGGEYLRTLRMAVPGQGEVCGWVRVGHRPEKNCLAVTLSLELLPVLPQVLARVRHTFDLSCDPHAIAEVLGAMDDLRPGLFVPGTRLPGCFDGFELSVRAVLGQQITVKAASTLAARLVAAHGTPIDTGIVELTHAFPRPETLLALGEGITEHLGQLGIISARSRSILALARLFAENPLPLGHCTDPRAQIARLVALPGIGAWTAHYIAMRTMGWTDAFLETDAAIKKALAPHTATDMLALAEAWRPWRSYATICLWNSLTTQGGTPCTT